MYTETLTDKINFRPLLYISHLERGVCAAYKRKAMDDARIESVH